MIRTFLRRRPKAAAPLAPSWQPAVTIAGDYPGWDEASRVSTGYDAAVILDRTREALVKVRDGAAAAERDSVLFDAPQYRFPLLAGLLHAALAEGGELRILDFGGALGSSYFQCRRFLGAVQRLEWCIVEQPAHVACGHAHFEDDTLKFFDTVDACLQVCRPTTLLLSGVLQYLRDPYATLAQLLEARLPHVILDRTGFLERDAERLTIQTVSEAIYPASFPAWFFSETRIRGLFSAAGYLLVADTPGPDDGSPADEGAYYKTFIYERAESTMLTSRHAGPSS